MSRRDCKETNVRTVGKEKEKRKKRSKNNTVKSSRGGGRENDVKEKQWRK